MEKTEVAAQGVALTVVNRRGLNRLYEHQATKPTHGT